ncbi:TPA: hypothetical protein N0F65_011061 [Lagenidium giganteum]|uniref:DJ-1/PfpI domain-containing protein n=1 Tax=Lagenidium giganteum TaxID=4803 RepID=A0AAV2ZAS5_9STRA|nr:TPA: hypothetical protein N0F65_011061 [Lagenidium giganteum]
MAAVLHAVSDLVAVKPTALIPVANGSEEIETAALVDVLARGGVRVTLADVGEDDDHFVTMAQGTIVQADKAISACTHLDFDVIVVPGGPGAATLAECQDLITLLKSQKNAGKLYGGICAGPVDVLLKHGLTSNVMTCYPESNKMLGAIYTDDRVVIADNCVTSQGPDTAIDMGLTLVELLRGEATAKKVADGIDAYDWKH